VKQAHEWLRLSQDGLVSIDLSSLRPIPSNQHHAESLCEAAQQLSFAASHRVEPNRLSSLTGVEVETRSQRKVSSTYESLPQEEHEHILSLLPDFASLKDLASSYTTLWHALGMRRKFVVDSIVQNDVGRHEEGLLPWYALVLSRFVEVGVSGLVGFFYHISITSAIARCRSGVRSFSRARRGR